jgi:ribonuclease HI
MNNWCYKWMNNGWINSAGNEVANRDLIEEALDLDERLEQRADTSVEYIWISRSENQLADDYCNQELDDC